jgi:ascorbate-specific PTS system EIIC-type component UlaA
MKNFLLFFFHILIFSILLQNFTYAQTGKITGKVVSNTGELLPFVNVLIVGTTQGAATDIDGNYVIIGISPGTYSIRASAIGYNAVTTQNVKVSIDLTTRIDFELAEESIELGEEVVVVATKPLVTSRCSNQTARYEGLNILYVHCFCG